MVAKIKPRPLSLYDSSFTGQQSLSLGGENCHETPRHIQWRRDDSATPFHVFTDKELDKVKYHPGSRLNIALLVEPPSLSDAHYQRAMDLYPFFDAILTPLVYAYRFHFDKVFSYHPGGTWIPFSQWGVHEKTGDVSIIISQKTRAEGHQLRRAVYDRFGERLTPFGRMFEDLPSKVPMLAPFRYSVVIESMKTMGYFTEKLIDCLAVGTVPLYHGDPDIRHHFPGLPTWDTLDQLQNLLDNPPLVPWTVSEWWRAKALQYTCAEDWIFLNRSVFHV